MRRPPPRLGTVQFQIMQVLWQRGPLTARQITDELARTSPITHSTVQTLLRQLESKEAIAHETQDRAFVYRPLIQQSDLTQNPLREVLTRAYQGSVINLMSHLLRTEKLSPEELARLRTMIDEEIEAEDKP
jgi:BlaI family transcriptional regulator, penicillinase repressor